MNKSIKRYLSKFDKKNEKFIGIVEFHLNPGIEYFQKIFNQRNNLMYDEYPITEEIKKKLKPFIKEDLDMDNYDYFLSCDDTR